MTRAEVSRPAVAPPASNGGPPAGSGSPSSGNGSRPAVLVSGLNRSFGDRQVLKGIDLTVAPGEFVALLGASGSGKTTILRSLAGLDAGSTGRVVVPKARAVVFQDHRLMPWKRVWRNVVLGVRGDATKRRAEQALAEVGILHVANAWPRTLSGGEAQRVALARALVRDADLWLLDEPFGALDALTRLNAQGLLRSLCDRHHPAVVLVTHDIEESVLLADRAVVLAEGEIVADVPIDIPRPRERADANFVALRKSLLSLVGVDESPPAVPASA